MEPGRFEKHCFLQSQSQFKHFEMHSYIRAFLRIFLLLPVTLTLDRSRFDQPVSSKMSAGKKTAEMPVNQCFLFDFGFVLV
jgi:hypothetical protein